MQRSAVIGVKEGVYFQAAEASGSTRWRIRLIRHVQPNSAAPVIVIFSLNVGGRRSWPNASLSVGREPRSDTAQMSELVSDAIIGDGRTHMEVAPWLTLWLELCLTVAVYVLNMFGDAMRGLLDPRLRGGGGRRDADAARAV